MVSAGQHFNTFARKIAKNSFTSFGAAGAAGAASNPEQNKKKIF